MRSKLLLTLLLLFAAAAANAAEDATTLRRARSLYQSATAHYNLSEFREALADYKEAYRFKQDPAFLYNIGQCHRQLGEPEDAAKAYRAYLRASPAAANRTEVEQFIADADSAVAERAKQATKPPVGAQTPQLGESGATAPLVAADATKPAAQKKTKTWVWVVVGVGAAVVVGAAVGLGVGLSQGPSAPSASLGNAGALQ